MGYIRHHAILITTWSDDAFDKLEAAVHEIYKHDSYFEHASSQWNGYQTLVIPPDGSKEGWPESEAGNTYRNLVIEWLEKQRYEDGSSPYSWVEVFYGDSANDGAGIERHSGNTKAAPAPHA